MKKKQKPNIFRNYLFITLLIAVSLIITGCGQDLTRAKAAEIITNSMKFPESVYYSLPVTELSRSAFYFDWEDSLKAWKALEAQGYITTKEIKYIKRMFRTRYAEKRIKISLTEKGKAQFPHSDRHFYKIELCKKVFNGVTGILKSNENTAIVEYTWKYTKLTPEGQIVLKISKLKGEDLDKIYKEEVTLKKYDDGWRIAN